MYTLTRIHGHGDVTFNFTLSTLYIHLCCDQYTTTVLSLPWRPVGSQSTRLQKYYHTRFLNCCLRFTVRHWCYGQVYRVIYFNEDIIILIFKLSIDVEEHHHLFIERRDISGELLYWLIIRLHSTVTANP